MYFSFKWYIFTIYNLSCSTKKEAEDILLKIVALVFLLAFAIAGDLRRYKISNVYTAAGLAAGLTINGIMNGFPGLLESMLAAVIPFAALIILFALRMIGAGDIKLFCAAGAIMGVRFILNAIPFSFLAGGIMALGVMLGRGNVKKRFGHIAAYVKAVCLSHVIIPYTDFSDKTDGAKFHFSPAIAAGCCIYLLILISYSGLPEF